ncbi:MAG: hypothetical protein CME31_18055 [Gimesia sp.]|nr:hypothetical protein [Gimesia sp.]|tara:strand:+ start:1306 stop:1545 length:240 start_codon:yes stop_codon:yes gene_type:complete
MREQWVNWIDASKTPDTEDKYLCAVRDITLEATILIYCEYTECNDGIYRWRNWETEELIPDWLLVTHWASKELPLPELT